MVFLTRRGRMGIGLNSSTWRIRDFEHPWTLGASLRRPSNTVACLTCPPRGTAGGSLRQRPRLPEPTLTPRLPRLPTEARTHHSVHAGAKWARRAFLPKLEGGVRLATQPHELRTRTTRDSTLDRDWYNRERLHQVLNYLRAPSSARKEIE